MSFPTESIIVLFLTEASRMRDTGNRRDDYYSYRPKLLPFGEISGVEKRTEEKTRERRETEREKKEDRGRERKRESIQCIQSSMYEW